MKENNRILITGASGQLGREFISYFLKTSYKIKGLTRKEVDFSDAQGILNLKKEILTFKPNFLINCAAYTAVDKAEEEIELAQIVNTNSVASIQSLAEELEFKILHFSTDYVFDGSGDEPWSEDDDTFPINVYGLTKRDGEDVLLDSENSLVLRVSWLYSEYGSNFPKTIHRLLGDRDELNVVNDQVSSPTWTKPLVEFVVENLLSKPELFNGALYHYAEDGEGSWYDMALIINEFHKKKINSVSSEEFIQLAKRPSYSKLNNSKAKNILGLRPKTWDENLREFLKIIQNT